jgi:protein-export membrane protein SecD
MTHRNNIIIFFVILGIFAFTLWALFPLDAQRFGKKGLHLGLDLVGGVHLVYEAQFAENATAADKSAAVDRAVITIQKRIDTYGVTEPIIQKMGEDRILVQLPGFTDIDAAKKLVEQTGFLDFREVERDTSGGLVYLSTYLDGNLTDFVDKSEKSKRLFVGEENAKGSSPPVAFLVKDDNGFRFTDPNGNPIGSANLTRYSKSPSWIQSRGDDGTPLTGNLLSDAQSVLSQQVSGAKPEVSITWNAQGAVIFDQIAKRIHNPAGQGGTYSLEYALGIFLDNNLLSAPQMTSVSYEGSGVISGSFTTAEATELANLLKSGSLPVELKKPPLYQQKISATLGADFINMAWKAGLIGLLLVMLFMIIYYRLPGFLASLSLIFYGTLTLAIFKLWPAPQLTLTLAGLGGFIASIGMAVDANVLIFERMKEEFRMGRTLGAAIEAGFNRAWSAIRDSNLTTFIACIILAAIGSNIAAGGPVKWFGITLFIGVAISMFTAITVTRTLLRLFIGTSLANKSWLFTPGGGKKNNV